MPCYELDGIVPVVDPTAFVHPTAVLIGDVIVGPRCYVGPGAALRGDFGRIVMEEGSNVQDNCVVHCFPDRDTVIGVDGHIGHGAVLHGCRIGRNALVGMGAVVMDMAEIGENAMVGGMAFVPTGMKVAPRMLVAGVPARVMRELSDKDIAWKSNGTAQYQRLAARCLAGMRECAPLAAPEADRARNQGTDAVPLKVFRAKT